MTDWLAAVDAHLCQRLRCCTACGAVVTLVWIGVVEVQGLGIPYALCAACQRRQGGEAGLQGILAPRYGRFAAAHQPQDEAYHDVDECGAEQEPGD